MPNRDDSRRRFPLPGNPASNARSQPPQEQRAPLRMVRGVTQLLFNYLPGRTVDWEDGLAIVRLDQVVFSSVWPAEKSRVVLQEVTRLLARWRSRGGTVNAQFPDPARDPGRFVIGLPGAIEASVLNTSFICKRCSRLFFPGRDGLPSGARQVLTCPSCGTRSLRQFSQVFVHGCGELVPVSGWLPWMRRGAQGRFEGSKLPLRCSECGDLSQPGLPVGASVRGT